MRHSLLWAITMPMYARAAAIWGFQQLVTELGGDPGNVFRRAGVDPARLSHPDDRLPLTEIRHLLNYSAEETGCSHFGLELGRRRDPDQTMGILGEAFQRARDFRQAIACLFELFRLHSESSLWQLHEENGKCYALVSFLHQENDPSTQSQQLVVSVLWRLFNMVTRGRWHPLMLSFTFGKPQDPAPLKRYFKVPIDFDADSCGIVFHALDLDIPVAPDATGSYNELYRTAQSMALSRPQTLSETTRVLVRKNLELRRVGLDYISHFFPFDRRTLQRRLKQEQTSYQKILNEVRTSMAKAALLSSDIPMAQLSHRLCFCDVANFIKAFKSEEGMTPRQWQQLHRQQVRNASASG